MIEASFLEKAWADSLLECSDSLVTLELKFDGNVMSDSMLLRIKKAGSDGTGRDRELLLSMRTTVFIVGLLATLSWTHKRAM